MSNSSSEDFGSLATQIFLCTTLLRNYRIPARCSHPVGRVIKRVNVSDHNYSAQHIATLLCPSKGLKYFDAAIGEKDPSNLAGIAVAINVQPSLEESHVALIARGTKQEETAEDSLLKLERVTTQVDHMKVLSEFKQQIHFGRQVEDVFAVINATLDKEIANSEDVCRLFLHYIIRRAGFRISDRLRVIRQLWHANGHPFVKFERIHFSYAEKFPWKVTVHNARLIQTLKKNGLPDTRLSSNKVYVQEEDLIVFLNTLTDTFKALSTALDSLNSLNGPQVTDNHIEDVVAHLESIVAFLDCRFLDRLMNQTNPRMTCLFEVLPEPLRVILNEILSRYRRDSVLKLEFDDVDPGKIIDEDLAIVSPDDLRGSGETPEASFLRAYDSLLADFRAYHHIVEANILTKPLAPYIVHFPKPTVDAVDLQQGCDNLYDLVSSQIPDFGNAREWLKSRLSTLVHDLKRDGGKLLHDTAEVHAVAGLVGLTNYAHTSSEEMTGGITITDGQKDVLEKALKGHDVSIGVSEACCISCWWMHYWSTEFYLKDSDTAIEPKEKTNIHIIGTSEIILPWFPPKIGVSNACLRFILERLVAFLSVVALEEGNLIIEGSANDPNDPLNFEDEFVSSGDDGSDSEDDGSETN